MSEQDDDLTIRIGLTEQKYLAMLARIDSQSFKSAKKIEDRFDKQNRSFVRGAERANRSANAFANGGLRNIGMQLSQVAQQGAVTGDYLKAASVQAADIGLAFGTVGIAVGAAISVLGPMAMNLVGVSNSADDAEKNVKSFVSSMEHLQALSAIATGDISELREEFGELADEVQRGAQIAAQAALSQAMTGMEDVADGLRGDLHGVIGDMADVAAAAEKLEQLRGNVDLGLATNDDLVSAERALEQLRESAALAANELGLTTSQVVLLESALQTLGGAKSMNDVASAAGDALDLIAGMFETGSLIPGEVSNITLALEEVQKAAARGVVAMEDIGDSAEKADRAAKSFIGTMSAADLSDVGAQAAFLAHQMGIAASEAVKYNNALNQSAGLPVEKAPGLSFGLNTVVGSSPTLEAPTGPLGFGNLDRLGYRNVRDLPKPPKSESKGGGSGKTDAEKKRADALREVNRWVETTRTSVEEYEAKLKDLEAMEPFFKATGNAEAYARAVSHVEKEFEDLKFERIQEGIESVSDAMASAIVNGENMGDALRQVFRQMAIDLLASGIKRQLSSLFFGGAGGGGKVGGLGKILGGLLSFDGGGWTGSGSRSGGVDGKGGFPAILHPNETVIDHTKGGAAGAGTTVQIYDHSGAVIRRETSVQPGGGRLEKIVIREAVADAIQTPGSAAHNGIRKMGVRPPIPRY